MEYIRGQYGFSMDDLRLTPQQLQEYQTAKQSVMENLLPNFAPGSDKPPGEIQISMGSEVMEKLSGTMSAGMEQAMDKLNPPSQAAQDASSPDSPIQQAPTVQVSVNIENAVTQDNEGMRLLADTVADRITPAVTSALGSDYNAY